jgi:hypothetical protein
MPIQSADNGDITECTAAYFPDSQLLGKRSIIPYSPHTLYTSLLSLSPLTNNHGMTCDVMSSTELGLECTMY